MSHGSHGCSCKKTAKRCPSCVVVRKCGRHHEKKVPRVRPGCEHVAYLSYANVPGYKFDYLCPANTVDAGGSHFQ